MLRAGGLQKAALPACITESGVYVLFRDRIEIARHQCTGAAFVIYF